LTPQATLPAGVSLRPAAEADRSFLQRLYRSVRWDELAPTGWPDQAKIEFLAGQFELQQRHYHLAFAGADFDVIEHEGLAIGRLSVDRTTPDLHLVEISLTPEWRGRGVGGALIARLQDEVRRGPAARIILNVERTNPSAQRLYQRLGFVESPPTSPYPGLSIEMVWPSPAD
jgi:ribosomal protein S18 acetylase RimI-like enzyme